MIRLIFILLCLVQAPAHAAPESYRLDASRSTVSFTYDLDGAAKTGRMPVRSADLLLDLDNVSASRVLVTLDAHAARAGFILATEAMKSRQVLDTARFPDIHFRSTRIRGDLRSATVTGELTLRGVTRPVTLEARLFRQRGTQANNHNNLVVELTGDISRAAFGAKRLPEPCRRHDPAADHCPDQQINHTRFDKKPKGFKTTWEMSNTRWQSPPAVTWWAHYAYADFLRRPVSVRHPASVIDRGRWAAGCHLGAGAEFHNGADRPAGVGPFLRLFHRLLVGTAPDGQCRPFPRLRRLHLCRGHRAAGAYAVDRRPMHGR